MTAPAGEHASSPATTGKTGRRGFTLPVWGWAIVGGGLLFGAYYVYKARKGSAAASASTDTTGSSGVATSNGYSTPTTILPMFQGSTPGTNSLTNAQFQQLQAANPPLPDQVYTVTGKGSYQIPTQAGSVSNNGATINDQWPAGAVIAAYNLAPTDLLNIAVYTTLLMAMNPGLTAPYPIGTQLRMPYNGTTPPPNTAPDPSSIKPQSPQSAEVNQAFQGNNGTSYLQSQSSTSGSSI